MSTEKEASSYFTVASGCDVTLAGTLEDIMYRAHHKYSG